MVELHGVGGVEGDEDNNDELYLNLPLLLDLLKPAS